MAILEAMAAGVVVISTRVGGLPDLIQDGVNGFLIDRSTEALRDRLAVLAESEELRFYLAGNAIQTIRIGYSPESVSRAYSEVYIQQFAQCRKVQVPGGRNNLP
jgi:glycosyltransferase involved in cell wall biosynthesis